MIAPRAIKLAVIIARLSCAVSLAVACSPLFGAPLPLKLVADVALTGNATRLDYESLDPGSGRLYIAHMGDGAVIVFNTRTRQVEATVKGIPSVRGVLAVPAVHRVFAASEGNGEVVVIDMRSNSIIARLRAGDVDGLAFDPVTERVFVSDEAGQRDVVVDAVRDKVIGAVPLGGEAGNTVYDAGSHQVLVAVQTSNELAEIDPASMHVIARYPLPGSVHSHGIALDETTRFAYIAGEMNSSVVAFDLRTKKVTARGGVGLGVDVLAVDRGLGRLYVASESGVVTVFDIARHGFTKIGQSGIGPNAHVVAVDARTHLVYFPLSDVHGRPTLRIMKPLTP
jgi:DNA-binding beta-propeller fold protein YncE